MVTTPNLFGPGYSLATLTEAINIIPNLWGRLQEYNLFPAEGITTRDIAIDLVNEYLTILPEREPGSPATVGRNEDRSVLSFRVPHIPHEELVLPADVQGRRAPGQIGPDTMTLAYQRKIEAGRRKFALTLEYLRMGALKGIIVGGSGKTLYNLYTVFGITQKSVDFVLGTKETDVDGKINEVLRHIEDHLLGEVMTGVKALVSPEFFDKFIAHPVIREAYKYYAATGAQPLREDVRRQFPYKGLIVEEYRGVGQLVDGTTARFIAAGEGHAFPLGTTSTFRTYFAPANKDEFVNTVGMEAYAWPVRTDDERGWRIIMESNPLPLCRRPQVLVKLFSSN